MKKINLIDTCNILMCMHVMILSIIDALNAHNFAIEALVVILFSIILVVILKEKESKDD